MPDEQALRAKARAVVQEGKLPAQRPDRVWGGPGVDAPCAVCALPVTKEEMEFEVEFARDGHGGGGDLDKYHLHRRCFAAWEFERTRAVVDITSPDTGISNVHTHTPGTMTPAAPYPKCSICAKPLLPSQNPVLDDGVCYHRECVERRVERPPGPAQQLAS